MNIDRYEFADIGPKKGFINVLRRICPELIIIALSDTQPDTRQNLPEGAFH
jgi:hypothetical protein